MTRQTARRHCRPSLLGLEERCLLNGTPISALSQYHAFFSGTDGGPVTVATFSDAQSAPYGYDVTINWGDGTSSPGSVAPDAVVSGKFNVTGAHTYLKPGVEFVSVSIMNVFQETQRTVSAVDPVVTPTPVVTATSVPGLAVGNAASGVQVATFTNTDLGLSASSFNASVDWGDGQTSGASIAADPNQPGRYVVTATKPDAFAHAGSPTLGVTVNVAGSSPAQTWVDVAGMPQGLGGVSSTFVNGLLYRIGGTTGTGQPTRTVDSFDPATNVWTPRANLPGNAVAVRATTASDGKIVVLGNDGDTNQILAYVYDPALDSWTTGPSLAVSPNGFSVTNGPDGRIYILGGNDAGVGSAKAYTYDPATGAFATLTDMPTGRFDLSAVTGPDGKIYAIGGNTGSVTSSEVDAYDPSTGTWTAVGSLLRERALLAAEVGPDGKIYAIGGYNNATGFGFDAEAFDPVSQTSAAIPALNGYRLYMDGSVGPDGRLYILGGAGPTAEVSAYNAIDTKGIGSAPLNVAKGTPTINWIDPANIVVGTALSSVQLNASSKTPGTFAYWPGPGTVLGSGLAQTLTTAFTPTDTADYDPVDATAHLNVLQLPAVVALSPTVIAGQAPTDALVARFTDALFTNATASDFTATVDWGDGTSSPGVITADPNVAGQFNVTATKSAAYTVATGEALKVTVRANGQSVPGVWTQVAAFDLKQAELAAAASGGKIYAIGGYLNDAGYTNRVVALDPATGVTTEVAPLPILLEDLAAVTGPDGTIYVFGGDNQGASALDVAYAYNPATDTWIAIAPLPVGRQYLGGAAGPDGKIYAIGGYDGDAQSAEVDAYDPATNTWTTVAPLPLALEAPGVATGPDGKIYVMGGDAGSGYSSAVYSYDTSTNVWTQRADMPVALSYFAAATAGDGTIYAIGGDSNNDYYRDTVYAYDTVTDTWTQAASLPDGAEENAAATGPDGRVYAIGGFTKSLGAGGFSVLGSTVTPTGIDQTTLTVSPGMATHVALSVPFSGTAGQARTATVTAFDDFGNVATGYSGSIALTSSDPQAALPPAATLINGVGTFSITLKTAGPETVTATDTVNAALTATDNELVVTPAGVSRLALTGGVGGVAGTVQTVTVRALDAFGNTATGFNNLVHLTSSDLQATLASDAALANGVGTFDVTLKTAGTQSITAADTSDPSKTDTDGGLVVSPAAATTFRVVGTSTALRLTLDVTAIDPYGNAATGYTGTVHFTGDPQSAMPADSTLTNGAGTFSVDFPTPGTKTVTTTDTGNPGLTGSGTFNVSRSATQGGKIVSSASQTFYGQNVTLTASFSASPAGSAPMTGTVTFFDGDTALGSAPLSSLSAAQVRADTLSVSGHATLSTSALAPGGHVIRAVYSGDANYSDATSVTPVSVNVIPAVTSTSLTSTTSADGTILSAAVTTTSPGQPSVGGTVSFYDGDTFLGTSPVTAGAATMSLSPLSAGVHSFRAVFSGGGTASSSVSTTQVSTDGPRIVGLSRYGVHASPTVLALTFDGPLDAARAGNPANYRILDGRGRSVPIGSVQYDPSTFTVTLSPAGRLDIHKAYTLTVFANTPTGVAGSSGLALDGAGTGQPGTNFTARITWTALSLPGRAPAVTFVNGRAHTYAGKFGPYVNAIVRAGSAALKSVFRVNAGSHAASDARPHPAGTGTVSVVGRGRKAGR